MTEIKNTMFCKDDACEKELLIQTIPQTRQLYNSPPSWPPKSPAAMTSERADFPSVFSQLTTLS